MPPKKDVFADLFPSSNGKKKTSMNEAMNTGRSQDSFSVFQAPASKQSDPFDVFATPANVATSDLDIFGQGKPDSMATCNVTGYNGADKTTHPTTNNDVNVTGYNGADKITHPTSNNDVNLLDDDFTDAFTVPTETKPSKSGSSGPSKSGSSTSGPSKSGSSIQHASIQSESSDAVLAELVDIGFSVSDANEAIARHGPDLQACVNAIMNKSAPRESKGANGINFNDLGQDLFSKANKLFNYSKTTVMNLQQNLQGSRTDNLPAWMRTQEEHKAQNRHKDVDESEYGNDEENLDREEIERFMRLQREKEKERGKQRYENIKKSTLTGLKGLSVKESSRYDTDDIPRRRTKSTKTDVKTGTAKTNTEKTNTANTNTAKTTAKTNTAKTNTANTNTAKTNTAKTDSKGPTTSVSGASSTLEVDLLGLTSTSSRDTSPLNQFDDVDYTTNKNTASEAFKNGDYSTALEAYQACLSKLSAKHELRVVINTNLALVYKLVGQLKQSLHAVEEATALIEEGEWQTSNTISNKPVKYWYVKLVAIKAEVLELSEKYAESLRYYLVLIQDLGTVDKKIMDGKRRVDKIVNPANHKPKPQPASTPVSSRPKPKTHANVEKAHAQLDGLEVDRINSRIQSWNAGKEDNLRLLLVNLDEIVPATVSLKPALRKLSGNDLMLPKQIKINYMKVISAIHPDKLASQCKDDKAAEKVCNGVFIILNKAWEKFKVENGM